MDDVRRLGRGREIDSDFNARLSERAIVAIGRLVSAAARPHRWGGAAVVVFRHAHRVTIRRRQKGARRGQEGRDEGDGGQAGSEETGHDRWPTCTACASRNGGETTGNQPNRFMSSGGYSRPVPDFPQGGGAPLA